MNANAKGAKNAKEEQREEGKRGRIVRKRLLIAPSIFFSAPALGVFLGVLGGTWRSHLSHLR